MTLGILRRVHRWIGLIVALPVALQGLTGAILAIQPMLPSFAAVSDAAPQSIAAIVAAALNGEASAARATHYFAPEPGGPARVRIAPADGKAQLVSVDPASLQVLDRQPADGSVQARLRALHVNFMAGDYGGRAIGGWFGIGLLALALSGVPIWWPRRGAWGGALAIARRTSGLALPLRLHRFVGGYAMLVLMVLAGTGAMLAFPQTSRAMLGLPAGAPRVARPPATQDAGQPDIDKAMALARQTAPQARLRMIALPTNPIEPLRVFLLHPDGDGAAGSIVLQIDASNGTLRSVQDARSQPLLERLYRWAHDIHEGIGLGPLWRLATVAAGLSLPVFAVTGPLIWWRHRRRTKRTVAEATLQTHA